jgi:hypothetical protein
VSLASTFGGPGGASLPSDARHGDHPVREPEHHHQRAEIGDVDDDISSGVDGHALAGATGGVLLREPLAQIVGVGIDHDGPRDIGGRLGASQQSLELAGRHDHAVRARLMGSALSRLGELVPHEHKLGLGVAQVESDLSLLEQHVHWHNHATWAQYAVVSERKIRNIRQHHSDSIAGLHAQLV